MSLTKIGSIGINTGIQLTGVTTISTLNASDNVLSVGGTVNFTGNVSIAGTLTYEDVTNVDSVGIITARSNILVGSGITLSPDGDIFFTGIMTGNGSGLTGVANTDVIFTDKITLPDSSQGSINVGLSSDLQIFHNGSHSYISHEGTGDLYIKSENNSADIYIASQDNLELRVNNNADIALQATGNAGTGLFHQGNQKIVTSSTGVTVTGTVAATAVTGDGSGLTGIGVTVADGGDVAYSYESGGKNYMVHIFTSTGKKGVFRTNKNMTIDFLLVGGGGGTAAAEGSYGQSGAGGGGGIVEGSGFSLSAGSYVIEVGAGGAATGSTTVGGNGGDTVFHNATGSADVTAKGGGGGGDYGSAGADGGCGGGGGNPNAAGGDENQSSQNSGISNITQYGFDGGTGGAYNSSPKGGGGGGGAGGAGGTATAAGDGNGGARGAGRANNLTGTNVTYSIGGRGGRSGYEHGFPGEANLGNGADGASASHPNEGIGAAGGAGIVVIRYEV